MSGVTIIEDYASARARFLALAKSAGADVKSHTHVVRGPKGEDLALDVAWFGPADAPKVFLCTSSMHGLEGPVGSAAQAAWIASGAPERLPRDVAVCLVHALNPWGFAYFARCTENNVDLNRNWLDFKGPPPQNPEYRYIRDLIRMRTFTAEAIGDLARGYEEVRAKLGAGRLSIAVNHGQYEDPQGLQFGGRAPEFGHRMVREHVLPRLSHARDVGLLDWHTGVGDYGETAYLITHGIDAALGARAVAWWGEENVRNWRRSPTEAEVEADVAGNNLPKKKLGQLYHELPHFLPNARVSGGIIEFGTEKPGSFEKLMLATLYELWLRFDNRGDRFAPAHRAHLETMREAFVPQDPAWRRMVIDKGPHLMDQVVAGLAQV